MSALEKKRRAAAAALGQLPRNATIGMGTGSTVNCLIEALAGNPLGLKAVASSEATGARLAAAGIEVVDLNSVGALIVYVDGADEATRRRHLIKGGGGALTREKIVAEAAREFVCILDDSKLVDALGGFALPIEVIPMAREMVSRRLVQFGGRSEWRRGFITDNGNHILDVRGLSFEDPAGLEAELDCIPGVVTVGLFARRPADVLLVGTEDGVIEI
ncbi:MAG TPA: ribose-5-phosphate isomerase RpiA [Steroidobacteraceae bacterium]|nr:ribose-5-phosphate isomerase RpiA [Steroidobacteraceae bacterium]